MQIKAFRQLVYDFYNQYQRDLPWRTPTLTVDSSGRLDPYKIMISEVMLQQTQASRVIPKYEAFLQLFPTLESLAGAEQATVLEAWSGLGYNRRARYLHTAARTIQELQAWPTNPETLSSLPGIGPNTAKAICVYAFNQPLVFIETNIRSVFLHHFFKNRSDVADSQLLPFIEESLDTTRPRQWYWALMDYGTYVKQQHANPSRRSRHHTKQSKFEGSRRQLRGMVIKSLLKHEKTLHQLRKELQDERLEPVLESLAQEGLITQQDGRYSL